MVSGELDNTASHRVIRGGKAALKAMVGLVQRGIAMTMPATACKFTLAKCPDNFRGSAFLGISPLVTRSVRVSILVIMWS